MLYHVWNHQSKPFLSSTDCILWNSDVAGVILGLTSCVLVLKLLLKHNQFDSCTYCVSGCRKRPDRRLKKNASSFRGSSTSVKKTTKSSTVTKRPTTPAEKKPDSRQLIVGQLTVRRVPRVDIDKMMMAGVKEMDVMWHSAADAAEALRSGSHDWQVASVVRSLNRATKKLIAKKAARQQRKLLQQLAAARDDAADVDEQSPLKTELPVDQVDQAVSSQSCRTDLLKHLLSSAPPEGVNNTTYESWMSLSCWGTAPLVHRIVIEYSRVIQQLNSRQAQAIANRLRVICININHT